MHIPIVQVMIVVVNGGTSSVSCTGSEHTTIRCSNNPSSIKNDRQADSLWECRNCGENVKYTWLYCTVCGMNTQSTVGVTCTGCGEYTGINLGGGRRCPGSYAQCPLCGVSGSSGTIPGKPCVHGFTSKALHCTHGYTR